MVAGWSPALNFDDDRQPPSQLQIEVGGTEEAVVLLPVGELDLATAGQLEQVVVRELAGGPPALVLDLSRVSFMDSVAVGTLLRCEERARGDGQRFAINAGSGQPQRLLELCGLVERFQDAGIPDLSESD
jgi:anti-anti-sigma factor